MNFTFPVWTKHFVCVFAFLACVTDKSVAQSETSSYEVPVDARSISMGQSFVAVERNPYALFYNPAGLSGLTGVSISYSQRDMNWFDSFTKGLKYHSLNTTVTTSFAVFAFSYNRFNLGEFTRTNSSGVEIGRISAYEHTFALGASHTFENGLSLGASVKTWNYINIGTSSAENPEGIPDEHKTLPILFDLGVLYHFFFISPGSTLSDKLSLGMSLQNYGSNMIIRDNAERQAFSIQPNRYFRVGAAYLIYVRNSETDLAPFMGMASFEYRKRLNGFSEAQSDFYGFGFEASIFEIFSARLGGYLANIKSIYGEPKSVASRYGFGLNVPFARIGVAIPLSVRFDYAAIPVNNSLSFDPNKMNSPLNTFTFTVQYNNELF